MLLAGTGSGIYGIAAGKGSALMAFEGAAVTAIAAADGRLLAAVRGQGVLRSQDRGGTWTAVLEGVNLRSMGVAPDGALYLGADPAAIYRSEDGSRFEELPAVRELPGYPAWTFPNPPHLGNIRFLAFGGNTTYAAVEVGGVIASRDRGRSWVELREGLHLDVHTVACASGRGPDQLYAATGQGFFHSRDAGATWEPACEGLGSLYLAPLALHPQRPEVVITAATQGRPRYWRGRPGGALAAIYRSESGGEAWQPAMDGLPETLPGAVEVLAVDPGQPDDVYAGTADGKVFQSRDAGCSWAVLAQDLPPVHCFAFGQ